LIHCVDTNQHSRYQTVKKKSESTPLIKQPVVWRTFIVPGSMTLGKVHRVVQAVMGWQDYHLHEFRFDAVRYGVPDLDDQSIWNEAPVTLVKALGPKTSFDYDYDFGDGWEHRVTVEQTLPPDPAFQWPRCTAGENACPPEDVGGPWGYADFLAAIKDRANPEHKAMMTWSGGQFDSKAFDLIGVNQRLVEVMLRRRP
jgi:hypothetical protein